MSEIAAGQAVIELLRAEGVEYVFGVTGLTTNSMVTQMYGREDIKFIDTRHEEGAILMAYGYSKSTGKPSVCMTTSGPGRGPTPSQGTGSARSSSGAAVEPGCASPPISSGADWPPGGF